MVRAMPSQGTRFSKRNTYTHTPTPHTSSNVRSGRRSLSTPLLLRQRKGGPSMIFGQSIHLRHDGSRAMASQPCSLGSPPLPAPRRPAISQVQLSPPLSVLSRSKTSGAGCLASGEPVINRCYPSIDPYRGGVPAGRSSEYPC